VRRRWASRIVRLERRGVITGYPARLDRSALGYPTTVGLMVVAVLDYERGLIMQPLAEIAEVEEIMLVPGDADLRVRVRVRVRVLGLGLGLVRDYTHLWEPPAEPHLANPGHSAHRSLDDDRRHADIGHGGASAPGHGTTGDDSHRPPMRVE